LLTRASDEAADVIVPAPATALSAVLSGLPSRVISVGFVSSAGRMASTLSASRAPTTANLHARLLLPIEGHVDAMTMAPRAAG
jgi:hypothetical protein